jgi:hypothetical protein
MYTEIEHLCENVYSNGAHKNNNDNNTIPIFIGVNKTTQKARMSQEEGSARKGKE